jgi:hypothetical protein
MFASVLSGTLLNWKHIKGDGLNAVEKIILYHRRIFNEIAVIWNALHANHEQPRLGEYLLKMLEAVNVEKKHFDEQWDAHVIPAIESLKIVKHGRNK